MNVLDSHINSSDGTFLANRDRMKQLVDELRRHVSRAGEGGGAKYVERHRQQGKLPVRDRVERLLDHGSPFVELSPLAAFAMYDGEAPGACHACIWSIPVERSCPCRPKSSPIAITSAAFFSTRPACRPSGSRRFPW